MKPRYLFRIDGAKENDPFFAARIQQFPDSLLAYKGRKITLGPGWTPDFIEVELIPGPPAFTITIIELENSAPAAAASCRKYLPEPPAEILTRFSEYLKQVEKLCNSTADPRLHDIRDLRSALARNPNIIIRTAGALRRSADFSELHTLLDQPDRTTDPSSPPPPAEPDLLFTGRRSLSRRDTEGLRRTLRILHSAFIGDDRTTAKLANWLESNYNPLDLALAQHPKQYPLLRNLIANKHWGGMTLDCDRLAAQLAQLWSESRKQPVVPADVAQLITRFLPQALAFSRDDSMAKLFPFARGALATSPLAP